eukprot:m.60677 g.60677  ORF g.60677 m.60677 type:complete len:460 (-) comp13297_c1_seq2:441-1820(-)
MKFSLALLSLLLLLLHSTCKGAYGLHHPCSPRGSYIADSVCRCHSPYTPRGLNVIQFHSNGEPQGLGYNTKCCRHCQCILESERLRYLHVGERNKHHEVRPFHIDDDQAELYKDIMVRMSKQQEGDDGAQTPQGLGDFNGLRGKFPSCDPHTARTASADVDGAIGAATAFLEGCKSKWTWARQFHNPLNKHARVLAAWFTFRVDGQRHMQVSCTDVSYIASWYESVMTLGLYATVLHDCLDPKLISVLENDYIKFSRVDHNTSSAIHYQQAPNDVRFVLFEEYLAHYQDPLKFVLMTDLHDVRFNRDPFSAMRARQDIHIFVGADRFAYKHNPFTWEILEWCAEAYGQLPLNPVFGNAMTLNCGVVGGQYGEVRRLLQHVIRLYRDRQFRKNGCYESWQRYCDMAMFAIALMTGYETLHEDIWLASGGLRQPYRYDSGPPFTNLFSSGDDAFPSYIIHK